MELSKKQHKEVRALVKKVVISQLEEAKKHIQDMIKKIKAEK